MNKVALSCFAALTCLGLAIPAPSAGTAGPLAARTFVREPIIIFTSERVTAVGVESSSLIVYQDGFVTATRSGDANSGFVPTLFTGGIGFLKARSWYGALLRVGSASLPDGPTPDPMDNGAATLTVLEPGTDSWSHTFSFGPGDYPQVEGTLGAIFLRLNL